VDKRSPHGKKRLLVCGATGFIGRNLTEHFGAKGRYAVTAVAFTEDPFPCRGVRWVCVDLRDARQVDRLVSGTDIIIQAAATTSGAKDIVTRPYHHVTDNAVMNSLLLRSAYEHAVERFVFFSCSVMYQPSEKLLKEKDFNADNEMVSAYFGVGWTKVYVEKMCEFYARLGRTRFTVIRHSNVYGPHDKFDLEHSHVFGATITKVMTATDGRVVVWGTGRERRDFLFVNDLVGLTQRALQRQESRFEIFNAGGGRAVAIDDLVRRVIALSGRKLTIVHDTSKPTIQTSLALNCGKARTLLGWTPRTTLTQGIRKTIAWYRRFQSPFRNSN
jgi:nucleoside-diphosphate-sugar epimerase